MKCLEKDRTRRYEAANALAADLKRHLENKPVVARPPSYRYQFRKLVQRNKVTFAASAAVTTLVAAGLIASVVLCKRAPICVTETFTVTFNNKMRKKKKKKKINKICDISRFSYE